MVKSLNFYTASEEGKKGQTAISKVTQDGPHRPWHPGLHRRRRGVDGHLHPRPGGHRHVHLCAVEAEAEGLLLHFSDRAGGVRRGVPLLRHTHVRAADAVDVVSIVYERKWYGIKRETEKVSTYLLV